MPKLTGFFSIPLDLDQIPISDIYHWIKFKGDIKYLENYIGNKILYPQTIPTQKDELEIDFAILREVLIRHPEIVYDPSQSKLTLTQEMESRFPPLMRLASLVIETVAFSKELTYVFLKGDKSSQLIGSVLSPTKVFSGSEVALIINGKETKVKNKSITILPIPEPHLKVQFPNSLELLVSGGSLGLAVNLAKK
ncbi:hypothetical protein HYS93_02150 [Candidatus Daviesbacteria bacterium]|nr:hypothetical protein [Candidatus Daviesbacteria bacterium]